MLNRLTYLSTGYPQVNRKGGNMKRAWLVALILVLSASPLFAAQTTKTLINDETISGSSPAVEADSYIGDAEKVTFFITYDSNRTTAAVTAKVTIAVSIDGTNWHDISWFDVAGGATPQTSEDLSFVAGDGTYVGWFDKSLTAPQMRIRVNITAAGITKSYGPGETADVTVTIIEKK